MADYRSFKEIKNRYMEHGATKYDANHILLPEYTKEQILEIAEACEMD